jgi:hypothetical protein
MCYDGGDSLKRVDLLCVYTQNPKAGAASFTLLNISCIPTLGIKQEFLRSSLLDAATVQEEGSGTYSGGVTGTRPGLSRRGTSTMADAKLFSESNGARSKYRRGQADSIARGKAQELRDELRQSGDKRDKGFVRKKTALKKVVANMTMGNDSKLPSPDRFGVKLIASVTLVPGRGAMHADSSPGH